MVLPSHQQSYLFVGSLIWVSQAWGPQDMKTEKQAGLLPVLLSRLHSLISSQPGYHNLGALPSAFVLADEHYGNVPSGFSSAGHILLWPCTVGLLPTCSLRNRLWSQYPASWIIETHKGMQKLIQKLLLLISYCCPDSVCQLLMPVIYSCRLT